MTTFIFDDLTQTPTILVPSRAKRAFQTGESASVKPEQNVDYFAKGNEHLTPPAVYQDADNWSVRVFKNKFPIVEDHEIIVHSPFADKDIEELPDEQVVKIIRAFLNRVSYYTSTDKEVLIFNNKGGKAGASLTHPHSQIIALKGFPGIIEKEKEEALKYYNAHNCCYWCDSIKAELAYAKRIVYETSHFVLFVPQASRWSYEMVLVPKEHKPNLEYINEVEINDFAAVLKAALASYDKVLNNPDRNFWIHTLRYEPFHWHVGFIPQVKVLGGLELGAGIWVSDKASPESAAAELSGRNPA